MKDRSLYILKGHERDNPPWRPAKPSLLSHALVLLGLMLACTVISVCAAFGAVYLVAQVLA